MQDFTVNIFGRFSSITWNFPNSATSGSSAILSDPVADPSADSIAIAIKSGPCTWTQLTKKLAFTGNKECVVTVTAKKAGYKDFIKEFSVDPSLLPIAVYGWGSYGTVLADGVAVTAPTLSGVDPTDATKAYTSTTPHICTVDPNTGAVTGKQAGNCGIELTLSKTGHNNNIQPYTVAVQGLFASIVWDAFPSSAEVGTPTAALNPPVSSPPAESYMITRKSGGCSWDNSGSILSFTDTPECILTVTATKTSYQSKSKDFSVTATPADITATAGSYGELIYLGEAATPSPLTGLDPEDADAAYVSADENICTVDRDTGALTGVDEGECRITLTLSKTGHNDKVITYTTTIALTAGDYKGKHIFKGLYLGNYVRGVFADVDGDSDFDLVVVRERGGLQYYRRNASDAPSPFTELTGSKNPFDGVASAIRLSPAFSDLNGDNKVDMVMGESNGTLRYFLNESTQSDIVFTEQTGTDNPFNGVDVGISSIPTFVDIDGDGDDDLVVGEGEGYVNYFLNESANSSITFTAKINTNNPFNSIDVGTSSFPAFADINGDNKIDLVVGESDGTLNYYLNESTETKTIFTEKTSTANPFNGFDIGSNSFPRFTDINGDSKLDLVVGGKSGILHYYLNESANNTITFTDKTESISPFNSVDVGSYTYPTFADINGDNKIDLVVGNLNGALSYYLNESTQNSLVFTEKTGNENPFNGMTLGNFAAPTFADITGDNKLDLVVGRDEGTLDYFLNESTTGTTSFTAKTSTNNPFDGFDVGSGSHPTFADINGDNKIDLVVGEYDGNLNYYLNESSGGTISFTPKTGGDNPFNGFDVGTNAAPAFADINNDSKLDLLLGETNGSFKYYLNESSGGTITFTEKTGNNNPFHGIDLENNSTPTFADIDGDGDLDLVSGRGSGGDILTVFNHYGTWVPFN